LMAMTKQNFRIFARSLRPTINFHPRRPVPLFRENCSSSAAGCSISWFCRAPFPTKRYNYDDDDPRAADSISWKR
jgi:hypothetical protein